MNYIGLSQISEISAFIGIYGQSRV